MSDLGSDVTDFDVSAGNEEADEFTPETLGDLGLWGGNNEDQDPNEIESGQGYEAENEYENYAGNEETEGDGQPTNFDPAYGNGNEFENMYPPETNGMGMDPDYNSVADSEGGGQYYPDQQQAGANENAFYDPSTNSGTNDTEDMNQPQMLDLNPSQQLGSQDFSTYGTQTQGDQVLPLSFEDPRLFQLDDILGPDQEIEQQRKQQELGSQRKSKLSNAQSLHSSEGVGEEENAVLGKDSKEGEQAESDYTGKDGETTVEIQLSPKQSLVEFEDIYMQLSDTCAMQQLSIENVEMPSLRSTPSPPSTPLTRMNVNACPSIESFFKLDDRGKIDFHVLLGRKIYSKEVRLDRTAGQIKVELSQIVKVPAKYIELRRNKNLVMDYKTLKDLGGKPGKKMRFTIEVNKRAEDFWDLKIPQENKLKPRPPIVKSLRVHAGRGWRSVSVSINFAEERKLFLGGYRNRATGSEHHHAFTQTPLLRKELRDTQHHKASQAFHESTGCSQTLITTYTQVDRPDYYTSCRKQRLLVAKSYQTACRWEKIRQKAAITIQRYWRRWLAIKEKDDRMTGLIKRVEWAEQVRKGRTETRLAIKDDELYRQYNPTTLLDIELLYRAINKWRKQEVDYVLAHRWGAEKKAALADIMEKEADLLLDLERAKSKILDDKGKHMVEDLYTKMGSPTRWLTRTGHFITLDTPDKGTARFFHGIYHELQQPVTSNEERLKLLDKLYKLIKDHRKVTADYLVQLIGREITLMQKNARERLLTGLRKRILNGFFALCRDDTFNPQSRILQTVPFDVMKLRKDMVQCKGCRKMLYRDQFTISRGVTVTNRCLTCMGLYRTCILRVDLNLYRRMLQELRHDEQQQGVESSITYLIDAYDLQFLVEKLWHGQSALSGIDDRYLLNLCRWLKDKPWTPWNCVLLTEEEAVAHLHIDDMTIAYQQSFFEKVRLRHNAARSYFERTAKTSLGLDTNLHMYCMGKEKERNMNMKGKRHGTLKRKVTTFSISSRNPSVNMKM